MAECRDCVWELHFVSCPIKSLIGLATIQDNPKQRVREIRTKYDQVCLNLDELVISHHPLQGILEQVSEGG